MSDLAYATCLNVSCDENAHREIPIVVTTISQKAGRELPGVTVTETTHWHLESDDDMICPGCGLPSSLSRELPRQIPRMVL